MSTCRPRKVLSPISNLRRLRYKRSQPSHRSSEVELARVKSRIAELTADTPADLIYDVHLELLAAFGRSIGYDFHSRPREEATATDLISVFGRFDRRAREREFGLQIFSEDAVEGDSTHVAWLIDLYLPERRRRQGAGTSLMEALLMLWGRMGVDEVRVMAAGDGQWAFPTWGFDPDPHRSPDGVILPLRLALPRSMSAPQSGSTEP